MFVYSQICLFVLYIRAIPTNISRQHIQRMERVVSKAHSNNIHAHEKTTQKVNDPIKNQTTMVTLLQWVWRA